MGELVNPYIAGAPVTDTRMFFGRGDVFQWIEASLAGQYADHILVLHGQRRVGKTSVLKQLGNHLPERYIPVFFDLQGRTHTTLERFLWWLSREIVRVLKQERDITAPQPEREDFERDPDYLEGRFLPALRELLGERNLLLTFDEFDNLEDPDVRETLARPLVDYLRRMMGQPGMNFIFSIGSSGRKLENMQAAYTEFFKTALYKKISFLDRANALDLVARPVEGLIEYDPAAVERIYQITSGHPYFIQLICHELFARCQRSGERRIPAADVEAVLDDVVERGTVNLKFVWDEADELEKWTLAGLAHIEGRADNRALGEFLRKQRVRFTPPALDSAVLHMREKDVLTTSNDFVIHLLRLWLLKNRPLEQVREELTEVNPIANRYIEIGQEFKDAGAYDKAIESFAQALAVDADNLPAQVGIAQVYLEQKDYARAVEEFGKALKIDDDDVAARSGLCDAYLALGDAARERNRPREAAQAWQKVLDINAEHTEARQRMASAQRGLAEAALAAGRDDEALSAFSEALRFTPEDEELSARFEQVRKEKKKRVVASWLARADKEQAARNWERVRTALEEALKVDPEDASLRERLVKIRDLERADRMSTLRAAGDAAAAAGRWEEAVAAYQQVLDIAPEDAGVQGRIADARAKQRDVKLQALQARARSLARAEKWDESLAVWNEAIALAPERAEPLRGEIAKVEAGRKLAQTYAAALAAFGKKQYERAIALFKEIVVQDENYKDASRYMAEAVTLRRTARKWWQSRWLWAGVTVAALAVAGWFLFRPGSAFLEALTAAPAAGSTAPATQSSGGAASVGPATATAAGPTPTAVPLSWSRVNSGSFLSKDGITAIALDPNDPGVMYVGTQNAGVYKSIDGGLSWQPASSGLARAEIDTLIMDPFDSKTLYAGTLLGGVYKTADGGATWQAVTESLPFGGENSSIVVADRSTAGHLYFTPHGGLYETSDGGNSWSEVFGAGGCPRALAGLVVDPSNGDILYAFGENRANCEGGVYRSADGGATWSQILTSSASAGNFHGLWMSAAGGLFLGSDSLHVTTDAGATWMTYDVVCDSLAFDPSGGSSMYCATDGAVYRSGNGGAAWNRLASVDGSSALAVSPADPATLFLGAAGLFQSVDGGGTWTEISSGLSRLRFELNEHDGALYALDESNVLYRSSDSGRTWSLLTYEGRGLAFSADGNTLYRAGDGTLYVSTNGGLVWEGQALPAEIGYSWRVYAHPFEAGVLFVSGAGESPPYVYYSEDSGQTWQAADGMTITNVCDVTLFFGQDQGSHVYGLDCGGGAFRSTDGGRTWQDLYNGPGWWHTDSDSRLLIDPADPDRLLQATRGAGIMLSADGGANWTTANEGLGSLFVNTLAYDPNDPAIVYAGTDGGAYVSFNGGETWGVVNDGLLGATVVYSILVDAQSNVYAATPYGIFRLEGK